MLTRETRATLAELAFEACEVAEDVYEAAGLYVDFDSEDADARVTGRAGAAKCADAWAEVASMVYRDRGQVQGGTRYAAMGSVGAAFFALSDAIRMWGAGDAEACAARAASARWSLGAAAESLSILASGKAV